MKVSNLRLGLLVCVCVILLDGANFRRVVYASGTCDMNTNSGGAYYYGSGTNLFNTQNTGFNDAVKPDYSSCLADAQSYALSQGGSACRNGAGVSQGTYGVAYYQVSWSVWWDSQLQGQVEQQYDCGDL